MSNFLAIATVTAALRRSLLNAVLADVSGAEVTTVRPQDGPNSGLPANRGVNIFMYQATPNAHWRNDDLPTRRSGEQTLRRPQAALDLHYLLSFYGSESSLEPQRLMGSAVAHLHSRPILPRNLIEATIADATFQFLANSDLAEQIDLVRLTPENLSLEELSRLWSVMLQARYALSLVYKAAVVLVEPQLTPRPALPVRDFTLAGVQLRRPLIERVVAAADEDAPIVPQSAVLIRGQRLRGEITELDLGGQVLPPTAASDRELAATLPPGLRAGPQSAIVRHRLAIGAPPAPHPIFASNPGAFMLHPEITGTPPALDVSVSNVQGGGAAPRSATVTVAVRPTVGAQQQALLELLDAEGVIYTFRAPPREADTALLSFAISNVQAGTYFFRVRIDGAESALILNPAGDPIGPQRPIP